MQEQRDFHIGDIVSVGTGYLVSPRLMEGVYDLSGFMAGEPVWTHQLPRVNRECRPVLLEQHPALAETFAEAEQVNRENWQTWLDVWVARHGKTLPVRPMNRNQHESIDPMSELAEVVPPDRIIPVVLDEPA